MMIDHEELIDAANSLEPLPVATARLIQVFGSDDWDPDEVVTIVTEDPALMGKVLRLANSAWSGSRESVGSVEGALMRIGASAVVALGLAAAVKPSLAGALPAYGMTANDAWEDAVAAATFAGVLREHCPGKVPDEGVATALLHNMGKVVMARSIEPEHGPFLDSARERNSDLAEAERELFDVSYAEIGAIIGQHWKLPAPMVHAIQHPPDPNGLAPDQSNARLLAHTVRLAVLAASTLRVELDSQALEFHSGSLALLGLVDEEFEILCAEMADRIEESRACFEA